MILHFSPTFDGMHSTPPSTSAGEAFLGPRALLDLLEVRLGLPLQPAIPAQALLAWQRCLTECDAPDRFFHRSLHVDALAVARTLLAWRSLWYEHGWRGHFAGRVSKRLEDMAAIEALARGRASLTQGQRIARVLAALDGGLAHGVDRLLLHDEASELPLLWRTLVERLRSELAPGVALEPQAGAHTDLGRVQRTLLARMTRAVTTPAPPEALNGDGSLILVHGISRDLSAQAIAEYLLGTPHVAAQTVVVAERDGIILDNALERTGLPRTGFQHYSRFRAVTQLVKLSLALSWEPLDPHLLLQFLIHPVGPLPAHARSELAAAVAREPGVGGTAWRRAIGTIGTRLRTKYEASEKDVAALESEIAWWLECERYPPAHGMPLAPAIERTRRCMTWLAGRLHALERDGEEAGEDDVLYAAAVAQSEALIAALTDLREQGETRIGRIALEQLADEVTALAPDPSARAQAGHVRATTEPAAITQCWPQVIWWDLAPHAPAPAYPWSQPELDELANEGVALPSVEALIRRRLRGWLRPILNASERLILVIHDRDEGQHPLRTQLASAFRNFVEIRIEEALLASGGRDAIPALNVPTETLALRPLPGRRRWWQLPRDCRIAAPPSVSYRHLDAVLHHPHQWVLEQSARLRQGRAADLSRDNLLNGNLAHRLLERFFEAFPHWAREDERAIRAWLADFLPALVRAEGALLCRPGHGVTRERVLTVLEKVVTRLLFHLRSAGIESVVAETSGEVPFADTRLTGRIDLLLRDRHGREVVLDVKWGGQKRRGEELAASRHLQLATYACMRRAAAGAWPYTAYYIASTGNVLAHDTSVFPHALTFPPAAAASPDAFWTRVTATYAWRRAQLDGGLVEVTAEGTARAEDFVSPPGLLDTGGGPDRFDRYTRLTGWEDGV